MNINQKIIVFIFTFASIASPISFENDPFQIVLLSGAVVKPGIYIFNKSEPNLHALIVKAGGPSSVCRFGKGVMITRIIEGKEKKQFHKMDVFQFIEEGPDSKQNITIEPDDRVYVEPRIGF
jgi:protein involved in polysaccharide export with SLBB domain